MGSMILDPLLSTQELGSESYPSDITWGTCGWVLTVWRPIRGAASA